ncbi:MAG: hypothetical protein ACJ72D_09305 [Marmoricola sp.]
MPVRRVLAATAVALLTPLALTGCGGSDPKPAASSPKPSASAPTALPTDADGNSVDTRGITLEKPKARSTIRPTATLSAVPGTGEILSAANARTIQGFPVPKGAKVKDPGALEETWQFDIRTDDPAEVLKFYRDVLPQLGYTVRTDVTYTVAYEDVHWDLVFDGKVSGSMSADPANHTVFVVVNPPGQPAFAGDDQ